MTRFEHSGRGETDTREKEDVSGTNTQTYQEIDKEMAERGESGTVKLRANGKKAVLAYLKGWLVYASYREEGSEKHGEEAAKAIPEPRDFRVRVRPSRPERIRMLWTYMEYIGRHNRLIPLYENPAEVNERTLIVTEVGNLDKKELPSGKRIGYSPDTERVRSYFGTTDESGYCLSNHSILFFEDGEVDEVERYKKNDDPVLIEDQPDDFGCRHLDIDADTEFGDPSVVKVDIDGWEVVRTADDDSFLGIL